MAAYNGVNGAPMTENAPLLIDVLRTSGASTERSSPTGRRRGRPAPTANGGLDVVMPAIGDPWGDALVAAVRAGEVAEEVIDDKVRRVLRLAARVGALGERRRPADRRRDGLDGDAVAHEIAARSFVLARNAGDVLPLDAARLRRVAVLGALADDARIQGGGSAQVTPVHVISPLAGLTAALPDTEVVYAVGADPRPKLPAARGLQWTPITADAARRGRRGALHRRPRHGVGALDGRPARRRRRVGAGLDRAGGHVHARRRRHPPPRGHRVRPVHADRRRQGAVRRAALRRERGRVDHVPVAGASAGSRST